MSGSSAAAQWARWGMDPDQRGGYHLLACSRGRFSARNFEEILNRFTPGSLDSLPQVTISYALDAYGGRHVGMAVHEAESGGEDRLGRDVMVTRYFCFPFQQLASGGVSYLAMYEGLREIDVGPGNDSLRTVDMSRDPATANADVERAAPVAALLLTGNPVCVIDAGYGGVAERLAFIDAVMALLPYGMRAELAAATWVIGTNRGHKFRLFFSDVPRSPRPSAPADHVVRLLPDDIHITLADETRVAPELTDTYRDWLQTQPVAPLRTWLAQMADPVPFKKDDILGMLDRVVGPGGTQPQGEATDMEAAGYSGSGTESPSSSTWKIAPPPERSSSAQLLPPRGNHAEASPAAQQLARCLQYLERRADARLTVAVAEVEKHLTSAERRTEESDQRVRKLFARDSRLTGFLEVGKRRAAFYEFLRLVVGTGVIDYQGYCLAEDIIGGQLPEELLRAINPLAADDLAVRLIVHHYLDGQYPTARPRELVELAAGARAFRKAHAQIVCGLAVQALEDALAAEIDDVRPLLAAHGYLAPVLAATQHDDLPYQVAALMSVLTPVVGESLDGAAARGILATDGQSAPTTALLLAILRMSDPGATREVLDCYMAGLADSADLDDRLRDALAARGFVGRAPGRPERETTEPSQAPEGDEPRPPRFSSRGLRAEPNTEPPDYPTTKSRIRTGTSAFRRRLVNPGGAMSDRPREDDDR